jgi:hypothetical protein
MSDLKITNAIKIVMITVFVAVVVSPVLAASDRSSKFAPRSWPEETIYRPECRIVRADGTWLGCSPMERDW